MKNHKRLKKNWNKEDLTILLWVADKYNQLHHKSVPHYVTPELLQSPEDWKNVAECVPGKSGPQCMFKWLSLKKHHLTEHPWTLDEEIDLKRLVEQKGQANWPEISQELYLVEGKRTFRSPKQCREHWTCYVNPNLKKGLWKPEEDLELLSQFIKLGKKWAEISKVLNGRTENAIKNRFNLLMEKEGELKGAANSDNRRQYALKIISQIESTNPSSAEKVKDEEKEKEEEVKVEEDEVHEINFFDREESELMSAEKMHFRIFTDSLQSPPLPPPDFSEVEVKVQNSQQAVIRKVKFCRVSLENLMEIQGVVPAVFDRDTMEIFLDNNVH